MSPIPTGFVKCHGQVKLTNKTMNNHEYAMWIEPQRMHLCALVCLVNLPVTVFFSDTAMGVKMDALHNSESDYVKAVFLVKDSMAIRQRSPWLWSDTIYYRLPQGKKVEAAIETMHQFAYTVSWELSVLFNFPSPHCVRSGSCLTRLGCSIHEKWSEKASFNLSQTTDLNRVNLAPSLHIICMPTTSHW